MDEFAIWEKEWRLATERKSCYLYNGPRDETVKGGARSSPPSLRLHVIIACWSLLSGLSSTSSRFPFALLVPGFHGSSTLLLRVLLTNEPFQTQKICTRRMDNGCCASGLCWWVAYPPSIPNRKVM